MRELFEKVGVQTWLLYSFLASFVVICAMYASRVKPKEFDNTIGDIGKQLYLVLWNPLIDYWYKFFTGIKNLYFFPIGVDHRVFKSRFSRIKNESGIASLEFVVNDHPITPKNNYYFLCLNVWAITIYIYWASKSIINCLYSSAHTDPFVKSLPIVIAAATLMLDTWILRSYAIMASNNGVSRLAVTSLRFIVCLCTASIAAFHIFCLVFSNDIQQVSQKNHLQRVVDSTDYKKLASLRDSLAAALYKSEALHFSVNLLSKGRKSTDRVFVFTETEMDRIFQEYVLPPERAGVGGKITPPAVAPFQSDLIVQENEPPCFAAWADKNACPRFANYAKEGFVQDVRIFGLSKKLNSKWFNVTKSYPELKDPSYYNQEEPLIKQYDDLRNKLFPPDFDKAATNDIATAVHVIEEGVAKSGIVATILMIAPILVIALFEVSVIIVKMIWGKTNVDEYMRLLESHGTETISRGITSDIQKSYLKFDSDYSIQDHLANFLEIFRLVLQPLLSSKMFAAVIFLCLFSALFKIVQIESMPWFAPIQDALKQFIVQIWSEFRV